MRQKHVFKAVVECRCPKEGCGNAFIKRVDVVYFSNEKGEIVELNII